jgi:hypothetical protein
MRCGRTTLSHLGADDDTVRPVYALRWKINAARAAPQRACRRSVRDRGQGGPGFWLGGADAA